MNGTQLRQWRQAHDLTLRDLAKALDDQVHYSTLTGWETAEEGNRPIPKWAEEKILSTTKLSFTLAELHDLLDIAREEKISFLQLLGDCIREHLARRRQAKASAPVSFATASLPQPLARVAEESATGYRLTAPATAVGAPPAAPPAPQTAAQTRAKGASNGE